MDGKNLYTGLDEILRQAMDINVGLIKSRAIFSIVEFEGLSYTNSSRKLFHYEFFRKEMEIIAGNPESVTGTPVQLVVSPMILKTGNADGEDYDKEMVLIKARVAV